MIDVRFSPECVHFMRDCGIAHELARTTINNRDRGLVTKGLDRIIAAHWFNESELVVVESVVQKKEIEPANERVRFAEVKANLVLALRSELPAGTVDPNMSMEEILRVVAESFGRVVACHPDQSPSHLYTGPWDGHEVRVPNCDSGGRLHFCGTFDPEEPSCTYVWVFDADAYQEWLNQDQSSILNPPDDFEHKAYLAQLTEHAQSFVENFESLYPGTESSSEAIQFSLAINVLRPALGDNWCRQNVLEPATAHPQYQSTGLHGADAMRGQANAVELGELLFNLQVFPGIDEKIEQLKKNDLESAVAELQAAKLLAHSSMPFRFNPRSGRKRSDYDLNVDLPSGYTAACDVKSKGEGTPVTDRSLLNSVKDACDQTPRDRALIIFVRLPSIWVANDSIKSVVDSVLASTFRNRKRVLAVVFFWDEWHELRTGAQAHIWKFREYMNESSRFYQEQDAHLIRSAVSQSFSGRWVKFPELAAQAVP